MPPKVFLIDDDDDLRHALVQGLELEGHEVTAFGGASEALSHVHRALEAVIVCDIRMPGMDGMALLDRVLEVDPDLPVVLITGHGDVALAVAAIQRGAYDFLEKPFDTDRLADRITKAWEKRCLVMENRRLRSGEAGAADLEVVLIGKSARMEQLRATVEAVATADVDVLLYGETGTGKELVSREIHRLSARCDKPFVAINCGALPGDIIESELFGHEAGAFTGAARKRIGKLEHANGGTVLLDEIESMPLDLQIKLLRVLEERCVVRLGSNVPIPVDIRFIAASKADLGDLSDQGLFRPDLYFRLNVVSVELPPLREHAEDIPEIFHFLVRSACRRYRRDLPEIKQEVLADLMNQAWPGNVRELRNHADRFVLGLDRVARRARSAESDGKNRATSLAAQVGAFERGVIEEALQRYDGRLRPVYEELSIARKTLYDKMRKYGL